MVKTSKIRKELPLNEGVISNLDHQRKVKIEWIPREYIEIIKLLTEIRDLLKSK